MPLNRVTWGPAMDKHLTPQTLRLMADPHPRLNPTESQTKVLPSVGRPIASYNDKSIPSTTLLVFRCNEEHRLKWHQLEIITLEFFRVFDVNVNTSSTFQSETSYLLDSLQSNSVYIFKIQSILLRPSRHIGFQDDGGPSEILKTSRETFLYVETSLPFVTTNSHGNAGPLNSKANINLLKSEYLTINSVGSYLSEG